MQRRYSTLWMYMGREFLLSFVVAFLFFFIIFFVNQLLLMAEDILSKQAPFGDVARLVLYATPAIIAMSVPFGSLVGGLMATGRLASDSELLIMKASGVPQRALIVPFLFLGLTYTIVSFVANDYLLPIGTINYGKLYRRLLTSAPALELRPYTVKRYKETTIVTGDMDGATMYDVVIIDSTADGASRVINAGRAELVDRGGSSGVLTLELDDVFIQQSKQSDPDAFEYSSASAMEYNILLTSFANFNAAISPREMSSVDVAAAIRKKETALRSRLNARAVDIRGKFAKLADDYLARSSSGSQVDSAMVRLKQAQTSLEALESKVIRDRTLEIYRLEYYKKFSIPAGAAFFVLLAFPLGSRARKSGRAVGFGLGLLVAVAYWGVLIGGQTLGLRAGFDPFLAMWVPNGLVVMFSIPFLVRGSRS